MKHQKISIFWFRRDLRLNDNSGLYHALQSGSPVLPIFIFDTEILDTLPDKNDRRVEFIHRELERLQKQLISLGSSLIIRRGKPLEVWKKIIRDYRIDTVFANRDYEPYAISRDEQVKQLLKEQGTDFRLFKDQVIFERGEILKSDGNPYVVFTPYKNRWLDTLNPGHLASFPSEKLFVNFCPAPAASLPQLPELGFDKTGFSFPSGEINTEIIKNYDKTRDFPAMDGTTRLGIHLRFGTISIRRLVQIAWELNRTFLSELIWREFFMMILYHFPHVVNRPFRERYSRIQWINDDEKFLRWCRGNTGYPLVDAGMRELNATGFMHNRVRMVTASFMAKHLLIDWRRGEQYFADKLLDFELSSNNGNWQWSAGCGCDAAPYFRIFNPTTQIRKFDPDLLYIRKWVPEHNNSTYPSPIIDHKFARERALAVYGVALKGK
ncbi:MAG: deoxyribodipyrimidine photo-lyase [Calditrichia bacterium]